MNGLRMMSNEDQKEHFRKNKIWCCPCREYTRHYLDEDGYIYCRGCDDRIKRINLDSMPDAAIGKDGG